MTCRLIRGTCLVGSLASARGATRSAPPVRTSCPGRAEADGSVPPRPATKRAALFPPSKDPSRVETGWRQHDGDEINPTRAASKEGVSKFKVGQHHALPTPPPSSSLCLPSCWKYHPRTPCPTLRPPVEPEHIVGSDSSDGDACSRVAAPSRSSALHRAGTRSCPRPSTSARPGATRAMPGLRRILDARGGPRPEAPHMPSV